MSTTTTAGAIVAALVVVLVSLEWILAAPGRSHAGGDLGGNLAWAVHHTVRDHGGPLSWFQASARRKTPPTSEVPTFYKATAVPGMRNGGAPVGDSSSSLLPRKRSRWTTRALFGDSSQGETEGEEEAEGEAEKE